MNADQFAATVVIFLIVYAWGCLNRGWTSPVDIWVDMRSRRAGQPCSGHETPSSEPPGHDDHPAHHPMSTQGPLREPQPLRQPLTGPVDLIPHQPVDEQDRRQYETGAAWARRQIDAGLLSPGEIDSIGAERFDVSERTVRRWRKAVGDDRPGNKDTERTA